MPDESAILEKSPLQKLSVKSVKRKDKKKKKGQKNIFLRDIEINSIKEALLKEIDMSKLKEALVDDIKTTLLKEIDMSGIKEALVKEIAIKDLIGGKSDLIDVVTTSEEKKIEKKKQVNLPGYKYGLVDSFLKTHQEILTVYTTIMSNAKDKDYAILPLMLSQFSKKCFDHFNDEEELYTFMKALAGSRSEIERRIAMEFSAEMKNLSLELFTILNQSRFIPVNDTTVVGFIDEFQQLGDVLQERIKREEAVLYPMYENSRQVVDIC
jgi:hypothetical protein